MTDEIEYQTDSIAPEQYSITLGVSAPSGRVAALEIGVWTATGKAEALAFAKKALGHTVGWVRRNAQNNVSEYDWDPEIMDEHTVIVGSTVEEFTDQGTQRGWDFEEGGKKMEWRN